ncbi:uncharacterized protein LOC126761333 [Bactrocera neohumeralis]|uniref:Uncharacterized protein LOC105232911 n=1 Tax=Bactrocera dorsalis TaxID=27457 RepID=A0A6I9VHU8_BACDO|nr:uncharacterized protein LOC105232911 [Bactrocera dorsalis]XP_039966203.1 uncharacterized protein LOC120778463 [Bactrocera tryoni]XP_050333355.1 uncharacterized protein LOC126761333 [Bactrocera neohumeralis]
MKFLLLAIFVCCALFMAVSAVPVEEAIPEGIEGAHDTIEATDDKSILLKLKLLKKLLFLG